MRLYLGVTILPVIIIFGLLWWYWANQPACDFTVNEKGCQEVLFVIRKGKGLKEITSDLKAKGLIRNSLTFKILVLGNNLARRIQAGEFYLSSGDNPLKIARTLTRGTFDRKVTVLEGWRAEEIGEHLLKQGVNINLKVWLDEIQKREIEGYLFPDTYMIPKNTSVEKIISILTKNFDKKFTKELEQIALAKGIDKHSVVILASLIEKEVKTEQDRPIVAGILLKRLESNWTLRVDAAIQYAVADSRCKKVKEGSILQGENCDWWPKKLTKNDLNINSSYNTYVNRGLPPGPICNPGLSAIKAVIYSQGSDFWFYLSDSGGSIHYAKTNEEQAENIIRYLR